MFHVISNHNQTISLQRYIDNRQSDLKVGLRSITYWIGWFNLGREFMIWHLTNDQLKTPITLKIEPGLYSFYDLKHILTGAGLKLSIEVNRVNGIVTVNVPLGYMVKMSKGLRSALGLGTSSEDWIAGTFMGDKPTNFAPFKYLYVHLNQINTQTNFVDGVPSTLIGVVPITDKPFGESVTVRYEHPEFRQLINGTISELEVRITDENNRQLDNHGLPISVVLEIKNL